MNSLIMRSGITVLLLGTLATLPLVTRLVTPPPESSSAALMPEAIAPETPLTPNQREYVYYPGGGFYYSPRTRQWFWPENGGWKHGLSLPEQFWDASGDGMPIVLETDLPYLEHKKVVEHYSELQQMLAYHNEASELGGVVR